MKKAGAVLALGAAAGAIVYKAHEGIFHALLNRDFTVPESISKIISGTDDEYALEEKSALVRNLQWLEGYGYEKYTMVNSRGQKLRGYLMRPAKESNVYVFGSHGYRSSGKGEWCHYAKHWVEELGYNMFFVDHQAAGESEGKYIGFSSLESKDALEWLSFMTEEFGSDIQIILHGISMGSATVMLMTGSGKLPENVKFTIADCGFTSAYNEFACKLKALHLPELSLSLVNSISRKKAGFDLKKDTDALAAVAKAKIPMLFVHGGKDDFVPTYMGYELHEACSSEYKDFLLIPDADHAQSYRLGKADYDEKINEFIEKFIK